MKKKILGQLSNTEIYTEEMTEKDFLKDIIDKCLNKSLNIYKNRYCNTCSKLLENGKSTKNCPKCHHYFKYGMNSSKK